MTTGRSLARAGLIVTDRLPRLAAPRLGPPRGHRHDRSAPNAELDTFFAAFRMPDLIFQLVAAGALSSALIPVISGLLATDEEARAWRVASTVANVMLAILLVLALVVLVAAPADHPGRSRRASPTPSRRRRSSSPGSCWSARSCSPWARWRRACSTRRVGSRPRPWPRSSTTWRSSAACSSWTRRWASPVWRSGSSSARPATSASSSCRSARPASAGRRRIDLGDPSARQALLLMVPRALGLGASQLTFLVATSLASTSATGAVSAFSIAFSVFQIPIGVIGIPIGVVMLPSMSRDLARGDVGELREPRHAGAPADPLGDAPAGRPDDRPADGDRDPPVRLRPVRRAGRGADRDRPRLPRRSRSRPSRSSRSSPGRSTPAGTR